MDLLLNAGDKAVVDLRDDLAKQPCTALQRGTPLAVYRHLLNTVLTPVSLTITGFLSAFEVWLLANIMP